MTAPRHSWNATDPKRISACDSPDGNDRTEKTCARCGITKITVHGADNTCWLRWRMPQGFEGQMDRSPPCIEAKPELQVASETSTEVVFS